MITLVIHARHQVRDLLVNSVTAVTEVICDTLCVVFACIVSIPPTNCRIIVFIVLSSSTQNLNSVVHFSSRLLCVLWSVRVGCGAVHCLAFRHVPLWTWLYAAPCWGENDVTCRAAPRRAAPDPVWTQLQCYITVLAKARRGKEKRRWEDKTKDY